MQSKNYRMKWIEEFGKRVQNRKKTYGRNYKKRGKKFIKKY